MAEDIEEAQAVVDNAQEEVQEETLEDQLRAAIDQQENPAEIAPEAAEEDAAPDEVENEVGPEDELPPDNEGAQDELRAPDNWDAERKEAFAALPTTEAKETYLNTVKSLERGYQGKFDELATVRKEHEAISALLQPFEAQLNAAGMDRVAGIRQLVGAQQMLTQNPAQGIAQLVQQFGGQNAQAIVQQIAQQYGVMPAAQEGEAAYHDPDIQELRQDNAEIRSLLQQNETNAAASRQADAQNQINLFKQATDDSGNALHPHFDKVEAMMGTLIQGGFAPDMQSAYDQAVYANPELRATLINQQTSDVAEKLNNERKGKVEASKKASKNVKTNNTPPENAPPEPDNVRDSVAKAMREIAV